MVRSLLLLMAIVFATEAVAQETNLRAGRTLCGSLAAGDTVRYRLDTRSEYLVRGYVDQISVDVALRIVRPDGRVLRTIDGPAVGPERGKTLASPVGRSRN